MNFGARMFKTGLAVTLALYAAIWLKMGSPVIAAVAAIFAMQPSIYRSWRYLMDQLQTNTLGAVLAMLAGMVFSSEPFAIGIVCILVIMICLKLKMGDTIGLTLVTVVAVMEASGQWNFAVTRFVMSLIGIISAFLINILIFPPKPKVQFVEQVRRTFERLSLLMRTAVSDEMKETIFKEEQRALENDISSISDKYKLMEEDQKKLKTPKFGVSRQLVVYKQMLNTLRKGYEVIEAIEEHYFQAGRTEEIDRTFDQQIEKLIKFHEQIMLKFDHKLKPGSIDSEALQQDNDEFLRGILHQYKEGEKSSLRLSIVSSAIYDYGHQLDRLNRLAGHSPEHADA
ncbi:FUSC family protein [Paenibacillus pinistramenti]|uniref:FUSC family protein n=1 Tax=Paenibacillus pinistramenti TaxID=1768003 RepID=UPI0011083374|nr:aromatic acid exporter family protein [Paenibacillus pinistramenti]